MDQDVFNEFFAYLLNQASIEKKAELGDWLDNKLLEYLKVNPDCGIVWHQYSRLWRTNT